MLRTLAIASLGLACSSDTAATSTGDTSPTGENTSGGAPTSPEAQFRDALAGTPDEQTLAVSAAIRDALGADAEASLTALDWSTQSGDSLVGDAVLMQAWGVIATNLVGFKPFHGTTHADCNAVGEVLEGWASVTASVLNEVTGETSSIDFDIAAAAVLFFAKKCAQNYLTTIDGPFTLATHCSVQGGGGQGGGALCGTPGNSCCAGSCFEGTTCLGGLCL